MSPKKKSIIKDRIVELRRVRASELIPNPKNWRTHPSYQRDALSDILSQVGYADALLARETPDGLVLIDGHLRAETTPGADVPVLILDVDEAEADLILSTLDPLASMAHVDNEKLGDLLSGITTESDAIMALLESTANDYRALEPIGEPEIPQEEDFDTGGALDAAEGDAYVPFSARGQIWRLGDHRLMCGDATSAEDVERLDVSANLMVTDPPWGVNYDPEWRDRAAEKGQIQFAERRTGEVANDDRADWGDAYRLHAGNVIYSWPPAGPPQLQHGAAIEAAGFDLRMQMIWAKAHVPIGRGHYHVRHEPCWYAVRKGANAGWVGGHSQNTLWEVALDKNVEGGHSTQKPLECMERPIRHHEGDVYDPFVGSGTTIIAAEKLGRRCYAMEIEPRYVDVAIRRWEAFTGKKAEKVSS